MGSRNMRILSAVTRYVRAEASDQYQSTDPHYPR